MRRRIASVWLPRLETDLIARRRPEWRTRPLALYVETGQRLIVVAANAAAEAEGVAPGMSVADARALAAGLATAPHAPRRPARGQQALLRWLDRFGPLVAFDGRDGFLLDVTGVAHLFGGEGAWLDRLAEGLEDLGFAVRAALADTPGAAWALARHGTGREIAAPASARDVLAPLPVAALRLTPATAGRLARLGLARIGDLYDLPRAALVRRFGVDLATRLDQALGAAAEPISPARAPAPYRVRQGFAEPIGERPAIAAALDGLIGRLAARLDRDGRGAEALELTLRRLDGGTQTLAVRAAEPTRDPRRLARLFAERLDAVDPGFGIEAATLTAVRTGPIAARQADALGAEAPPEALAELIDALGARFGFAAVARFEARDRWAPERSFRLAPATAKAMTAAMAEVRRGPGWPAPPGPRPLLLLRPPEPVETVAGGGRLSPPRALRREGRWRRLARLAGPERIEPEWREPDPDWRGPRDYWRAEEETGARLWLYREGDAWFLHGFFP